MIEEEINNKSKITKLDIKRAKQSINCITNYIKKYFKSNPNLTKEQLMDNLENEFVNDANNYYYIIEELAGTNIQIIVTDYLLQNEDILKHEYQRLMRKHIQDDKNLYYTYDIKKSSRLLLKRLLYIIRNQVQERNMVLTNDEEYECLKNILKTVKPNLINLQKKNNVKILRTAKNFFDDYNILEKLTNQYNSQLNSLWLDDLNYTITPNNKYPNDIGVNNLLSQENLIQMPLEELSILNMFWQNKYAKELSNIGFGYFAFQQLDLYNKMSEDNFELSDNIIKNIILKYNVLERICTKIYNDKTKNKTKTTISCNFKDKYKYFFKSVFPNMTNDLNEDLNQCINRILASKNIYAIKANILCGTIVNLVDNKKIRNWGYINDNDNNVDNLNSIETNNKYILIGIDYSGLNRPVRVHVQKDLLQDALINTKQINTIPIYEGKNDFYNNYEYLPTHIVLPLEKRHKDFLRKQKYISANDFKYPIIAHMKFLANQDKFPEHLKKSQNGKMVRVRKYIDLCSGNILIENGKKLVPEDHDDKEER